jgi:hypothetical protein
MDPMPYLGAGLMVLVLLVAVCRAVLDEAEARQALSWPSVQGTILEGHAQGRRQGKSKIIRWYARMRFYFQAEGAYYGNQFEIQCDSEEGADQFVRENKGKPVIVRYKPSDPDTARAYPRERL